MIIIVNVSDKYFTLNGIQFAKIYQPLQSGSENIAIYNVNDTRQQLLNSTKFDELEIDGGVYGTQALTIAALLNVIYSARLSSEYEERIEQIELSQVSGFVSFKNLADLPETGDANTAYIVLDDDVSTSNNGTWGWNGSAYYQAGLDAAGNAEVSATEAKEMFKNFTNPPNIPFESSATQWLDGTISGDEFIDKSGNGFNADIIDNDIQLLKGFPFKSNAKIVQKAANFGNIPNPDEIWFTAGGVPKEIPVTAFVYNLNNINQIYSRIGRQELGANNVETYEPRTLDIVTYAAPLTDTDIFIAFSYYTGLDLDTLLKVVSVDGLDTNAGTEANPYLTITKLLSSLSAGGTGYVKNGTFSEADRIYNVSEFKMKGLSHAIHQTVATNRILWLEGGANPQELKNIEFDGNNVTGICIEMRNINTEIKIERCKVTGGTIRGYSGTSQTVKAIFKDSIFYGITGAQELINSTTAFDLIGCIFEGVCQYAALPNSGVKNIKYNLFNTKQSIALIRLAGVGDTVIHNNVFNMISGNAGKGIAFNNTVFSLGSLIVSFNEFKGTGSAIPLVLGGDILGALHPDANIVVNDNVANMDIDFTGSFMNIPNQTAPEVYNNIINLLAVEADSQYAIEIKSTGKQSDNYHVYNNILCQRISTGYGIRINPEGGGTGKLLTENGIIEKNSIFGGYYYNNLMSDNTHNIMINGQQNFAAQYNIIRGGGIGIIIKCEGIAASESLIMSNVLHDCRKPIYINGITGVKVYNNTIVNIGQALSGGCLNILDNLGVAGAVIKNNIFISPSGGNFIFSDAGSIANVTSDYNIFYFGDGVDPVINYGTGTYTWAAWQGLGNDLNSIVLTETQYNEMFNSQKNLDFSLRTGSQAIGNGVNLTATYEDGLDITTDFGTEKILPIVATKQRSTWDVGAFVN